jgi:hypothetical protein
MVIFYVLRGKEKSFFTYFVAINTYFVEINTYFEAI